MATYNFTIRAIDNLGAYADQTFSMTVNNTNLERWVIVGSTGLGHSPDGVNWTIEAGQSGGKVVYGNGRWVVYNGGNSSTAYAALGMNIRTSVDAYNWTTVASGIPNYTVPSTVVCVNNSSFNIASGTVVTPYQIQSLKYQNGLWTAFVASNWMTANSGATSMALEYTSPDLVTWTVKSATAWYSGGNITASVYINDHYTDSTGLTVVMCFMSGANIVYICSRQPAATALSYQTTGSNIAAQPTIAYTSGLYTAFTGTTGSPSTGPTAYTSIDGIGWTARNVGTQSSLYTLGNAYANGRLVARTTGNNAASTYVNYSLNGGRTWVNGATAFSYSAALGSGNYGQYVNQGMAYYGGKLIMIEGQISGPAYLLLSTDSGTSASELNPFGSGIGAPYGIAVRV